MLSSTKIYSTIDDPMAVFNEILLLSPSLAASQTPSKSSESPKSPKAPKEEEEKKFQAEENGERQKTVCFRRLSALELHEQEEAHEFREAHHARKTLMEVLPSEKEEKSDTIAMKGHILSHPLHKDSEWRSQRQQKLSNSMSKEEGQLEPETSTPEESKYHEVFDKYMGIGSCFGCLARHCMYTRFLKGSSYSGSHYSVAFAIQDIISKPNKWELECSNCVLNSMI